MAGVARSTFDTLRMTALAALFAWGLINVAFEVHGGTASEDLLPPWLLGRIAAAGLRADAYDFQTQVRDLNSMVDWTEPPPGTDTPERRRSRLAPHQIEILDSPQIKENGLCPYPPTAALLYAPLGRLWFRDAADVWLYVSLTLAAACAVLLWRAVEGRVGLLACAVMILHYPGTYYTLHLGQNSFLTLALLALGWAELIRGRDASAGFAWGLLAYKIHWLLAVGWLPLALGRPRALVGMAASAVSLAAGATLLLGPAAWERWFTQVQAYDQVYAFDPTFRDNILGLGCDLRCMAYRLAPQLPAPLVRPLGWAFIAGIVLVTWALHYRRPNRTSLLFGAALASPHLYFYDQVIFLLPLVDLWSRRRWFRPWQWVAAVLLTAGFYAAHPVMQYYDLEGPPTATLVVLGLWLLSLTLRGPA